MEAVKERNGAEPFVTLSEVAHKVARHYKARCWWAELEDLEQEAWVAILDAKKKWDPTRGTTLAHYVWRAAVYALRMYLWQTESPVTATQWYWSGRSRKTIAKPRREDSAVLDHLTAVEDPEAAEQWWAELEARLRATVRDGKRGKMAEAILLKGQSRDRVQKRFRVERWHTWHATQDAYKRIRDDIELRDMVACA